MKTKETQTKKEPKKKVIKIKSKSKQKRKKYIKKRKKSDFIEFPKSEQNNKDKVNLQSNLNNEENSIIRRNTENEQNNNALERATNQLYLNGIMNNIIPINQDTETINCENCNFITFFYQAKIELLVT